MGGHQHRYGWISTSLCMNIHSAMDVYQHSYEWVPIYVYGYILTSLWMGINIANEIYQHCFVRITYCYGWISISLWVVIDIAMNGYQIDEIHCYEWISNRWNTSPTVVSIALDLAILQIFYTMLFSFFGVKIETHRTRAIQ